MWRALPRLTILRRPMQRHPRLFNALRLTMVFLAAFSGAYGFISGSRAPQSGYDPHAFSIGVSFLFALSCVALATLTFRNRMLKRAARDALVRQNALSARNTVLEDALSRAHRLFEAQADLIVVRDAAGAIVQSNAAFARLAGVTARPANRDGAPDVRRQSEVTIEADGARLHDQEIATASGTRWIAWRETSIQGPAGSVEWQCVGRDITRRVETEHQLANARAQADAANRAKSRFLAMASHEIRTPLNGILGMSGLLLDTPLTAEQATYVRAVKSSGDTLLTLIEELLDDARIEAGKLNLAETPFPLGEMIEDIAELLAPRAQARGLEIAAMVDERLPSHILGDAARLRQVLMNLAGNALKFTTEGGVTLRADRGADETLVLTVQDTGIGIAPEAQARIFGEFEQGEASTADRYGGVGLGLPISERIVRRMGGHMKLQSMSGEGTTFTVSLPLKPAAQSESSTWAAPELDGKAVLIVASKRIEASLTAARLDRWGAQTCHAADLAIATALLPERAWHAVLIDHDIPRDARDAFATAARRHAARRILMLTPSERAALRGGVPDCFTAYLMKPLRAVSLAARMRDETPALPVALSAEDAGAPPRRTARGLAVLVAEDNEINALLVSALLARLGHDPVVVAEGAAACDAWLLAIRAGTPYDLVLMDLQMPGLDGVRAARTIRRLERERGDARTPIFALTANAMGDDRAACADADMDGFLAKPLDRDTLHAVLQTLARQASVAA